jgi:NitT/TauT family transport system ATP-binding protein
MQTAAKRAAEGAGPEAFPISEKGIYLRQLSKQYPVKGGTMTALDDIDLSIREGEFVVIVGPSGCGKTSLLRILAGLEKPTGGNVDIDIDAGDRPLRSMVFQGNGIFPWLKVIDNAAYGLAARGVPKAERYAIAGEYLEKLGIGQFRDAWPRQLSGGMLQRVNLARAFANDPAILLMDEPFGALDEQTKILAYADLLGLWEKTKKTVIFITHSIDEAIILADRVCVMSRRPGRIKDSFEVTIPRPRAVFDLQNDLEFMRIRKEVWASLREEVLPAGDGQEHSA